MSHDSSAQHHTNQCQSAEYALVHTIASRHHPRKHAVKVSHWPRVSSFISPIMDLGFSTGSSRRAFGPHWSSTRLSAILVWISLSYTVNWEIGLAAAASRHQKTWKQTARVSTIQNFWGSMINPTMLLPDSIKSLSVGRQAKQSVCFAWFHKALIHRWSRGGCSG